MHPVIPCPRPIQQHHRIDPEELQSLKDQLEVVTKERDDKINEVRSRIPM